MTHLQHLAPSETLEAVRGSILLDDIRSLLDEACDIQKFAYVYTKNTLSLIIDILSRSSSWYSEVICSYCLLVPNNYSVLDNESRVGKVMPKA